MAESAFSQTLFPLSFPRVAFLLQAIHIAIVQPRQPRKELSILGRKLLIERRPTNTGTTTVASATCTGTPYTVTSSDTCLSISQAKSIATDRLITENGLDYNCTSLKAGTTLCLGQTCALKTITLNETCADITANENFSIVQLVSWNP